MALYLVTYDLNKTGKNYDDLLNQLRSFPGYNHCQKSVWLIVSNDNATGVFEKLKPHLDEDDHILVVKWGGEYQGWMPKDFWKWLHDNGY